MIRVTDKRGADERGRTVTVNEQELLFCVASVPVQVTRDSPTVKAEPLGGAHAMVTGAVPPVAAGGA
jgi:hypothetical protein